MGDPYLASYLRFLARSSSSKPSMKVYCVRSGSQSHEPDNIVSRDAATEGHGGNIWESGTSKKDGRPRRSAEGAQTGRFERHAETFGQRLKFGYMQEFE